MFVLLKDEDKDVLSGSQFAKNAVFYKDMLCFYDAYVKITDRIDQLPGFCFGVDKKLCLEGICLLIKMYATEFKFETLKLTLEYLKVLYFAIASYSEEGVVDSENIIAEFDGYRQASETFCEEQKKGVLAKQEEIKKSEKDISQKTYKAISMEGRAKGMKITAWIVLALSILGIVAPLLIYMNMPSETLIFGVAVGFDVLGFIIFVTCMIASAKLRNHASDLVYHVQNLKKDLELSMAEFNEVQLKFYRVFCEKYEYSMCFSELFSNYTKVLNIDEILEKANEYKLLSYNISYDISRLFRSQQREIDNLVLRIERVVFDADYQSEFADIYRQIISQDWLYYNAGVRYHFIKKFTDFAERGHNWKLQFNNEKVNPFDVNVKNLVREKIAFTEADDVKLVKTTLSELLQTKYFKSLEDLNFTNGYSVEALKKVKSHYLMQFYHLDSLDDQKAVFFDDKATKKIPAKYNTIEALSRIPAFVGLKLKLIEDSTGIGNSDARVIKTIASEMFTDYIKEDFQNLSFSEDDIDYPKFTAEKMEDEGDHVVYYVNGDAKIGYKLN